MCRDPAWLFCFGTGYASLGRFDLHRPFLPSRSRRSGMPDGSCPRPSQLRHATVTPPLILSTTTAIGLALDPEAEEASYVEPPALLLHHWKVDTGLITHWVPIGTFRGPLPFA